MKNVINSVSEINIGDKIEYDIWHKGVGYTGETKIFAVDEELLVVMKNYCSDDECRHHRFRKFLSTHDYS